MRCLGTWCCYSYVGSLCGRSRGNCISGLVNWRFYRTGSVCDGRDLAVHDDEGIIITAKEVLIFVAVEKKR